MMRLEELEKSLNEMELPKEVVLSPVEVVRDVRRMIRAHIAILRANSGKRTYKPYYDRLKKLHDESAKKKM